MSFRVHLTEQSGRLTPFRGRIEKIVSKIESEVGVRMSLPDMDVVISDDPMGAIPEIGIGGMARNEHLLLISIDPNHVWSGAEFEHALRGTIAHEIHHCVRMGSVGYGETLFDALITEGLADHFDQEVNGGDPSLWSVALDDAQQETWLKRAREEFDRTSYDHAAWFYGKEGGQPKWAGYTLGYYLVGEYLNRSKKKASGLVNTPSSDFR